MSKKLISLFCLFGLTLWMGLTLWSCGSKDKTPAGPITISHTDIDRTPGTSNGYYNVDEGVEIPETGKNKVWDYSKWTISRQSTTRYNSLPSGANYTGATYTIPFNFALLGAIGPFDAWDVFRIDNREWSRLGNYIDAKGVFDIPGQTDGSTITFNGGTNAYDKPHMFMEFPLTYGTKGSSKSVLKYDFVINSPSNRLKDTPAQQINTYTSSYECVGYGKLILPNEPAIDALLLEVTETENYKYYLGGQLAPEALISQFGLVNDETIVRKYYRFMSNELGGDAALINVYLNGNNALFKKRK